jgi:regulator of protease activity HflC (stomatin/prohibitin superfamily)
MAIAIFGILIILIGFTVVRRNPELSKYAGIVEIFGAFLLLAGLVSTSIVQIGAGEVGVKTLFGKVEPGILNSGLNMINPLEEVTKFPIRTQNYTMSAQHSEGDVLGDDAIRVLSADGLEVVIDLTVLYRVIPSEAPKVLQSIGPDYKNTIVRPVTRTKIRDNAVYYDAVTLYSTKREEFQQRIFTTIEKEFKFRGLLLENLLIRNIALPESVKTTIESKINAEQEAQKMQFVLQKEKQEAERKRVEAQGIADYQKIISTQLSDKQLQYESIKAQKEIALSHNTKVIIMGNTKGSPVMLSDK